MLEVLWTVPPTLQDERLASARVGGIWADDAIFLDGIARRERMARPWTDWTPWVDTDGAEQWVKDVLGQEIVWQGLHRWNTLHFKVGLNISGTGSATLKVYYANTVIFQQTRTGTGGWVWEDSADLSGISVGTYALARVRFKLQTSMGTLARIQVQYIEERTDISTSYATPEDYRDGVVYSAASLNKIPSALNALNALARWPVPGMPEFASPTKSPDPEETLVTLKQFHHGDTLRYGIRVKYDGGSKTRIVEWRILYAGHEVAKGTYNEGFNAIGEGKLYAGEANIAPYATQNTLVDIEVKWRVYGGPSDDRGNGQVIVQYLANVDRSASSGGLPGAILPTAPVYGNTTGQTATLRRIGDLIREMADDGGGGYNQTGKARLFPRNPYLPIVPCSNYSLIYMGWPTLRYRVKSASLKWGDGQQVKLEDWPTGGNIRCRTLDLRGLANLLPGQVLYITSQEGTKIDYAAETRS